MIAVLLAMLAVLGTTPAIRAQDGETAYAAGRYEAAARAFEAALARPDAPRGTLLYNLGNCAYRLSRPARAVLYYERALLRLPRDPRVQANLRLARQQLGLADDGFAAVALARIDALAPQTLLALITLLQIAGLLGLVLLRRQGARLAALALLLLAGLLAARLVQTQVFPDPPAGIVLADEISVHTEPHPAEPVTLHLAAGETVRIAERSDRWMRVVHARGGGWTECSGVGLVD